LSSNNIKLSKNELIFSKINNFILENKYGIIITIGFLMVVGYISFFHHNYWFEYDGIYYLHQGEEVFRGNGENTRLYGSTITGPVIYHSVNSILNDGFLTLKLFALFGGGGIIFISYCIVKNIFNIKIAIISQLLIAFNARFILQSTWALNEQLPLVFTFLSLYFMTKKEIKIKDIVIIGILLGISFSIRYQAIFVLIGFLIFLLIRNKNIKINIKYSLIIITIVIVTASPLFLYNYSTYGSIMDSDPNFYILQSKFQTPEWRNILLNASANEEKISGIFLNFELFLENYFYNLFNHNPNSLFNFNTWVNLSIIPIIPYIGIIPVILGLTYVLKIEIRKIMIVTIILLVITSIIVLIFGNIEKHFFALIIIPIVILSILQIKKIDKQLLPLLIISTTFFMGISIIPIHRADQLFTMWIIIPILTTISIIEVIPKIIFKINKNKSEIKKSSTKIIILIIIIILVTNAVFSYRTMMVYFYEDMPEDINTEISKLISEIPRNQTGEEIKVIGDILKKQTGIENSYVMSDSVSYAFYANSKYLFTSFQEGKRGDSINEFVTRENWSDYEIYFSNIASHPPDRKNENKPIPDYIILHKLSKIYSDNPWDEKNKQYHDLMEILDPTSSKVPNNFELLYINNQTSTVVYKIHENE
jgi:hypothetical protein